MTSYSQTVTSDSISFVDGARTLYVTKADIESTGLLQARQTIADFVETPVECVTITLDGSGNITNLLLDFP